MELIHTVRRFLQSVKVKIRIRFNERGSEMASNDQTDFSK